MAKSPKKKKKSAKSSNTRRERRFRTITTYMPVWVGVVGILGSAVLGAGVFGLWILDPALKWASYLVAAGGFGLGLALWFGQPAETAVAIGDSGIAVEQGRDLSRVPWFQMSSLHISGASMVVEGSSSTLKFLLGANPHAAAWALKEAAERVPDIVDVSKEATEKLPAAGEVKGKSRNVKDDQVAGVRCASSNKVINLEEDARLCPKCGQVFHKDGVPESCPDCETELKGRTLTA